MPKTTKKKGVNRKTKHEITNRNPVLGLRSMNIETTDLNNIYKMRIKENNECTGSMSFQDCELAILRSAVDNAKVLEGNKTVNAPEVKTMISILEAFLRRKKLICYGGISINAVLDKEDQFYNFDTEIPDYDFFSKNALDDAIELADLYLEIGFEEVEAKSGVHHGTYKVFVNYIGIADITFIHKEIFDALKKEAITVDGIHYCPPNYLRMSMYLELSRPAGDVSRWEKVLKRLTLLNKKYPLKAVDCDKLEFQRSLDTVVKKGEEAKVFDVVKNTLVDQDVVFFGSFALSLYSQYMPHELQTKLEKIPDFDVLSLHPQKTAKAIQKKMENEAGVRNVTIKRHDAVGEIISEHYRIFIGKESIVSIYKPIACHSYNEITVAKQTLKIATIDTMLSLYLAFLYSSRAYYDVSRIACMAQFLFEVQQKNKLNQTGLLKRFSISCFGEQETLLSMRAHKAHMYNVLKKNPNSREYKEWFLRYRPMEKIKEIPENKERDQDTKHKKFKKTTQRKRRRKKILK